jgi:cytochrome bd ubiquinol oxidase subunit II
VPDDTLAFVWLTVIAFAIFMYVLLDGFVLGSGILFSFVPKDTDRDAMMMSVAPIWDGNETWLVLGTGALFAVFPLAYSIVLPALYLPFMIMLLGLVFRGVAFEFRFKASGKTKKIWDRSFQWGSIVATFAQGTILGAFVQGFEVEGSRYAGGSFDWFTPFGIVTGLALIAGYALLGSTWLILKTTNGLEAWARQVSARLLLVVLGMIALISAWVPQLDNDIQARWFSLPNFYVLSQVPLATIVTGYLHWRATRSRSHAWPFVLTMVLFVLGYAGLAISLWPYIVPHEVPYWEAAATATTQGFLLVGVAVTLPAVLAYTAYSYYVFRGKVRGTHGY